MADDTPNRATLAVVDSKVATVDAKVDGLADLIKAEMAATRETIADLKGLPVAVATIRADLHALDRREQDADADMDRRVTAIETQHVRAVSWKVSAAVAGMAAILGGLLGHVHIPL